MGKPIILIENKLIRRIKQGDMLAFDEIYNRYNKRLYSFAIKLLKSNKEAEDIVQEVFVKIWQKRNDLNENLSFQSYLFTIAYNTTISVIRKRMVDEKFVESIKHLQQYDLEDSVSASIEYDELNEKLHSTINSLPDRQKQVYLLSREEELTYAEIAERLHISVNTVENHMVKALKFIRNNIGESTLISLLFINLMV